MKTEGPESMSAGDIGDYGLIMEEVKRRFSYRDHYLREDGSVELHLHPSPNLKEAFVDLIRAIKPKGFLAVLRKIDGELVMWVGKWAPTTQFRLRTPIILFLVTLTTISTDGFLRAVNFPGYGPLTMILLYTAGVLGIIGIHELGHKFVSSVYGIKSSMPYFIPGLPGAIPTMGAVISSAEPPINRDNLFDLGISGPLAGLAVTLIVGIAGALTSSYLPIEVIQERTALGELRQIEQMDHFTQFLLHVFTREAEGYGLVLSPLLFAASLGFLVTFLNLMPAWQLDGGHVARAALSPTQHKLATYASVVIFLLLRFELMALLVLLLSLKAPEMRPLDDVSSLSKERKIGFLLTMALAAAIYYFAIRNNPFFFPAS